MPRNAKNWKGWCERIGRPSKSPSVRIVLAAADGPNNTEIARRLALDADTVRPWRVRWLGLQTVSLEDLSLTKRLSDAPKPGTPARITPEQVCQAEIELAILCAQCLDRRLSDFKTLAREVAAWEDDRNATASWRTGASPLPMRVPAQASLSVPRPVKHDPVRTYSAVRYDPLSALKTRSSRR